MKKTIRILTVSLIAIFAFALAAIGFSFKVNAADIELEQGASIRVDTSESGYSGLRFSAKIDDALMGNLFSEGAYKENVTVSMLIAPEKAFEAYSYRSEAQSSLNYLEFFKAKYGFEREQISADIPAEKIIDGVVKGVLKVNEANYGMKYQAVVYYTTDGGATYVFSGKSVARSVSCVASAAKNYTEIPEQLESGVATFIGGDLGETSHSFENGVCTVCGTTPEIVGGVHGVAVDLGISYDDMRKPVSEQTSSISAPVTIDLGKDYGAAKNISYDGVKDSEITLSGANLTVPAKYFGTDAIGKHEIYIRTEQGAVSVPLYVATKIIKTTNEFGSTFRSMAANVKTYGYFVLGNDLDYEGNALGDAYSLNCGGLCGTFDGREYTIRNLNTANRAGLFVNIAYANSSVIKNVNFTDLVHSGNVTANIFGYLVAGTTFENITINVKSSVVAEGSTMTSSNYRQEYYGFLTGYNMDKCSFKNVTINAEGQEIYSLFGYWCKRASATAQPMTCENVVVSAKKVYYLGREDGNGDKIIYDVETYGNSVAGLTINVAAEKQDITKELYETGTTSYLVDLGVTDITKSLGQQTLAGNSVSLNIGEGYGTLSSVEFNGAIDGATYENGILTFPLGANFSAGHAGQERTIVMTSSSETANYTLNIHVLFSTKVIKTTNDIQSTFRSQTSKPTVYGYFVLGNDLDYEGKALSNHEGGDSEGGLGSGLCGTFDGRGYTIKNFNTGNKYGLFVKIAYGTGAVIKNLNFTDLVHTGTQYANIFGFMIGGATFENITINVKSSAVVDGLTMSTKGMGFICGTYMDKCTFKNITVNAEGQEIYSLFGYWCKRASATAQPMTCENVVVNAKKVYYLGREDGNGDKIIYDVETYGNGVAGLTINLPASQLLADGATEYSVIVPARTLSDGSTISAEYGTAIGASNELQKFMKEASGKEFAWYHEGIVPSGFNGKYISIGGTSRLSAVMGEIPVLNENEYFIKTIDGNVYIAGGDSAGLYYGVYDFLKTHFNYEYYADGVYYIDTNVSNCTLKNYTGEVVKPSFTYRLSAYGFESGSAITDSNFTQRMKYNSMGGQLVGTDAVNGSLHNFFATIPYETYGSSHSNWFYRYRESIFSSYENRQLCLSRDLNGLAAEVVSKIKNILNANASVKYIVFGQEDNDYWCDCSTCTSYINSCGGFKSATYIRFMNKVSDLLADYTAQNDREVYLVMFAYHATQDAPVTGTSGNYSLVNSDMKLRDNVCVMYAPIEANYYVSFNDEVNADVKKNIEGWSLVSQKVFYWFYMENFEYYLDFFDNFGSIGENLKFAAEHNGLYLFNNAQYNQSESTGFSHFKAYLNAKLMYNANEDVEELTNGFFANYYGAAGDIMKNIYTEIRAMFKTKYQNDGTIGYLSTKAHKCGKADYDFDKLVEWLGDIDSAYAAIAFLQTSDSAEYARIYKAIKVESMAIRYWILYYYPEDYRSYYTANVNPAGISIVAMRQAWKDDAAELGITLWGEHKSIDNLYSESWTGLK